MACEESALGISACLPEQAALERLLAALSHPLAHSVCVYILVRPLPFQQETGRSITRAFEKYCLCVCVCCMTAKGFDMGWQEIDRGSVRVVYKPVMWVN